MQIGKELHDVFSFVELNARSKILGSVVEEKFPGDGETKIHKYVHITLKNPQIQLLAHFELRDKFLVMAYKDHAPLVRIECLRDDGKMAEIDVIGGLIQNEKSRLLEQEPRKAKETLLTFGERCHLGVHFIAGE